MMTGTYQRLGVSIWANERDVVRRAYKRIALKHRRSLTRQARAARKEFYRIMLCEHRDARALAVAFRL